jgi:hypothetical protein
MRKGILFSLLLPLIAGASDAELQPALPAFQEIPVERLELQKKLAASEAARKDVIARNMHLSDEQAALFWPLYFDYRQRIGDTDRQALSTVVHFAELQSENRLSDLDANQLLESSLEREKLRTALRRSYLLKVRQALDARIAMRFYQLDAQLEHEVRGAMLQQLPLLQ